MLYQTENPHGGELHGKVIDFSANINPLGTPSSVKQAVAASLTLLCHYPDPYCRELTEAIAAYEGVSQDRILCGNGAAELIFTFCQALKPKKALLPVPSFSEYRTALEAAGCEAVYYDLSQEKGFRLGDDFLPVLQAFDGELLMLCNPNNPTGLVIGQPLLERILDICREKRIFLFVDECFLDLTENGVSLKASLDEENLLLLKAFTKSFGMPGLRLGYCLCGNASLLKEMGKQCQAWNVSIPAQLAGIAALKETAFLETANAIIHSQRPVMIEALRKLGLTVLESKTNFILFHSEKELRAPLLERGYQIRDCSNYPGLTEGWYRIAVKLPEENMGLLSNLEEILNG